MKCVAVTASSPLHAAVALTSPKPSTPSSVTTRTSVNVDASWTTRAPRTLSAAFARALTVVVSTAAIVGPGTSGTGVGELLERGRDRRHAAPRAPARRARAVASSGLIGVAVQLLPAAGLGDDDARRARPRAAPPGEGLVRSGLTRSGSSASTTDVSKLPAWPLHRALDRVRIDEIGRHRGRGDEAELARRLGDGDRAGGGVAAVAR